MILPSKLSCAACRRRSHCGSPPRRGARCLAGVSCQCLTHYSDSSINHLIIAWIYDCRILHTPQLSPDVVYGIPAFDLPAVCRTALKIVSGWKKAGLFSLKSFWGKSGVVRGPHTLERGATGAELGPRRPGHEASG